MNNGFIRTIGWVKEKLAQGVPYTPESELEITMRNVMQVVRNGAPLTRLRDDQIYKGGRLG